MSFSPLQTQPYYLAGAGSVIGSTSITLKTMKDIDGNAITMAFFGAIGYGTLEPGNNTLEEQISFTGITNNANGTTTLTGVMSVDFETPYTSTSGLLKTHAGSSVFVISNTSGFYSQFGIKQNTETVTGLWSVPDPVNVMNIANKQWVLSVVNGGAVSTNAVIVSGIAGETVAAGNLVYLKAADGRWWKASASASATIDSLQLGIAQGAGTAGVSITSGVNIFGLDLTQSGLVAGTVYYAGNTAGSISSSAGTVTKIIGHALNTTSLYFDPYFGSLPTGAQFAALTGTGTPSSTNKYATASSIPLIASDGSDSDVTIASGTTTLTRDMYYNNLTVNGTGTLATAGFKVFVKGTTTVTTAGGGGGIVCKGGNGGNGGNAVSTTGGTAGAAGAAAGTGTQTAAAVAGQAGGVGSNQGGSSGNGTAGTTTVSNIVASAGAAGGAGGNGSGGQAGGTAGAAGASSSAAAIAMRDIVTASVPMIFTSATAVQRANVTPGSGSGGGGGTANGGGGGGGGSGASGGHLFLATVFLSITGTGAINANGGNGGNGGNGITNGGGGGGGGGGNGGVATVMYVSKSGTGTITASAGTAGTKGTGTGGGANGADGAAGTAGTVIEITVS